MIVCDHLRDLKYQVTSTGGDFSVRRPVKESTLPQWIVGAEAWLTAAFLKIARQGYRTTLSLPHCVYTYTMIYYANTHR